jgi:hypothetical protein
LDNKGVKISIVTRTIADRPIIPAVPDQKIRASIELKTGLFPEEITAEKPSSLVKENKTLTV